MAPVYLKTDVHCPGCEKKIRKILGKIDGVEKVWASFQTDEVHVFGSADAEVLRKRLATKLRRSVTIESYGRVEDAPAPAPRAPTPPPSPPRYQTRPSSPPNYPAPPPPRSNDGYYYNPPSNDGYYNYQPPSNDGYNYYPPSNNGNYYNPLPSNDGYYNYPPPPPPPSNDGYYPYSYDGSLATFSDENPNACSVQ